MVKAKKQFVQKICLWSLSAAAFLFIFVNPSGAAQTDSPDAIALRVMPNAEHYSPASWYKRNIKVQGAPQALIVDGYEAVRDGRTVYVNAANISGNSLYTNIYIISYNQAAEPSTIDIFGQILDHWKFNVNLSQSARCSKSSNLGCLNYNDCPAGEYCLSKKAQVIRDVKRQADLQQVKSLLDSYKNKYGYFPKLAAGSYLAANSVSVWPSWQGTLAKSLSATLPLDPVNALGGCPAQFDKTTCWDAVNKRFAGEISGGRIVLPAQSRAYAYTAADDGLSYKLCAVTESGYLAEVACLP